VRLTVKNGEYRDFVLSRFRGLPETLDKSENGIERDTAWHAEIELLIAPALGLSPHSKRLFAMTMV
jgi:hypothetical protein